MLYLSTRADTCIMESSPFLDTGVHNSSISKDSDQANDIGIIHAYIYIDIELGQHF